MTDIMIDVETLSTRPDAVVLSIGARKFTLDEANGFPVFGDPFLVIPSITEQIALGRHVDMETVAWWQQQSSEAKAHWRDASDSCISESIGNINNFFWDVDPVNLVWAHGTDFDIPILKSLFGIVKLPWKYNAVRDARTVYRLLPRLRIKPPDAISLTGVKHHPVDDCDDQIWHLWERLKSTGDASETI